MDMVVLGAGVIGLTTAVTLAEAGHHVRVRTAEMPQGTTSAAADAVWGPWLVEPRERVVPWAASGLRVLTKLAAQAKTGVNVASGVSVSTERYEPPSWFSLLPDVRQCTPDELPDGYTHGVRYAVPLIDMPTYLNYLTRRLSSAGSTITIDPVARLDQAAGTADVLVNCTGLGARALAEDSQLYPIRGQTVVVTNPGISEFLDADTGDSTELLGIYPHRDHVILSGVAQANSWAREPDATTATAILARCTAISPILSKARVIGHRVGLRPTRPEIRLEEQPSRTRARIIHNYGHGGAGVSLAWGCAEETLTLIDQP